MKPDASILRVEGVTKRFKGLVAVNDVSLAVERCQGRNCASHVAAVIARRTGRPIEEIAPPTARPPIKPVGVAAIADERFQNDSEVVIE